MSDTPATPRMCLHQIAVPASSCRWCGDEKISALMDGMAAEEAETERLTSQRDALVKALERAERVIQWMAPYLGKMAAPSNGIADLNEHWLYIEQLQRQGILPKQKPQPSAMNTPLNKRARASIKE